MRELARVICVVMGYMVSAAASNGSGIERTDCCIVDQINGAVFILDRTTRRLRIPGQRAQF